MSSILPSFSDRKMSIRGRSFGLNFSLTLVPTFDVGDSDGKASACNAGDPASIPGLERSPEEGNGNLLQYSYLENSMDRGACLAIVHGITESDTTERLTLDVDGARV